MPKVDHSIHPNMLHISDDDFWSSSRVPRGESGLAHLREAVALGRAGDAAAWDALATYHTANLEAFWRYELARLKTDPSIGNATVADIVERYGDFKWIATRSNVHRLGWVCPPVFALADTQCETSHAFLVELLRRYYAARDRRPEKHGLEHPILGALSASFKVGALVPCYLALLNSDAGCPRDVVEAVSKMMMGIGRWLYNRVMPFRIHNVHTGACDGLFRVARLFPELDHAGRWNRRGTAMIQRHFRDSFADDGGHKERVWGYGFYTLWRMHDLYRLAEVRGGMGDDDEFLERLREGYRWFAKSLGPGDLKPSYGDCEFFSGKSIIDRAADLFPDTDDRYFGVDRTQSYHLSDSGFAIMRNGDDDKASYINCNVGRYYGWHSHHDLLAMNFWAMGQPLLEELDRFGSYGNPLDFVFRAPSSHNQLLIDEFFYDARDQPARDVHWYSDAHIDYLSAYHNAYRWLPDKAGCAYVTSMDAIVRRTIVFVKSRGYAVVLDSVRDELADTFNRAVTAHWHSPFGFEQVDERTARTKGSPACLIQFARADGLRSMTIGADYAGDYAAKGELFPERFHLRTRRWMPSGYQGCVGFAALLWPFKARGPKATIKPLDVDGSVTFRAEAFEVSGGSWTDRIVLNPEQLAGMKWRNRPMKDRARIELHDRPRAVRI